MKILYIGQYSEGTTSRMRAETLKTILNPKEFEVIDIHIPFYQTNPILRSLGFRYKKGPLIRKINQYVIASIQQEYYDLVWVDKAVFIHPKTTKLLKSKTKKLVHFTPDPAFTFHKSTYFIRSLTLYDYVVTTKSYELNHYKKATNAKLLFATQGYDKNLHLPSDIPFESKKGVAFIGHHEQEREQVLDGLLAANVPLVLAGIKWERFVNRHESNPLLEYLGEGVYGSAYVETIQNAKIAWGALSKWVPEQHTTRTFEIPACGTALLTERNPETESFYMDDEVIFYENHQELISKVKYYLNQEEELKEITQKGLNKVRKDGFDYDSILNKILTTILS